MEKGRVRNGGSYFRLLWFSCYQKKTLTYINTVCLVHTEEREKDKIPLPWEQIAVIFKVNRGLKAKLVEPILYCPSWAIVGDSNIWYLSFIWSSGLLCSEFLCYTFDNTYKYFTFSLMKKINRITPTAPKCKHFLFIFCYITLNSGFHSSIILMVWIHNGICQLLQLFGVLFLFFS